MMKWHYLFVIMLPCSSLFSSRIIVDEIRAVVYHEDGARIILSSDIKPDLDGRPRTLRDAVLEEIMLLEAEHLHFTVTDDDAEDYLAELQKNNHMSRAAMERVMEDMGYSYAEGREKLRRRQAIERLIDFRIRSDKRFIVTREDVEKFESEHPVYEQGVYTLAQVVLPDHLIKDKYTQKELDVLKWEEPFEVQENEVAEDKKFLADVQLGSIVDREIVEGGIELTRLVARKPRRRVTVDELYDQVVNRIRMERFDVLMKDFQKNMLGKSTIRFTHPQDQQFVLEQK
jgi:hypothetical protein